MNRSLREIAMDLYAWSTEIKPHSKDAYHGIGDIAGEILDHARNLEEALGLGDTK